jgi:hypothetical protein
VANALFFHVRSPAGFKWGSSLLPVFSGFIYCTLDAQLRFTGAFYYFTPNFFDAFV